MTTICSYCLDLLLYFLFSDAEGLQLVTGEIGERSTYIVTDVKGCTAIVSSKSRLPCAKLKNKDRQKDSYWPEEEVTCH